MVIVFIIVFILKGFKLGLLVIYVLILFNSKLRLFLDVIIVDGFCLLILIVVELGKIIKEKIGIFVLYILIKCFMCL